MSCIQSGAVWVLLVLRQGPVDAMSLCSWERPSVPDSPASSSRALALHRMGSPSVLWSQHCKPQFLLSLFTCSLQRELMHFSAVFLLALPSETTDFNVYPFYSAVTWDGSVTHFRNLPWEQTIRESLHITHGCLLLDCNAKTLQMLYAL